MEHLLKVTPGNVGCHCHSTTLYLLYSESLSALELHEPSGHQTPEIRRRCSIRVVAHRKNNCWVFEPRRVSTCDPRGDPGLLRRRIRS